LYNIRRNVGKVPFDPLCGKRLAATEMKKFRLKFFDTFKCIFSRATAPTVQLSLAGTGCSSILDIHVRPPQRLLSAFVARPEIISVLWIWIWIWLDSATHMLCAR